MHNADLQPIDQFRHPPCAVQGTRMTETESPFEDAAKENDRELEELPIDFGRND